ncbi:unnamed protein product [Rhizophagus irregularis]|nr:unnamed protein product [Rhizophagus irregularis]
MTGKRNNKASGTSAPKRPAQSPSSGNVQGQGSSTSTPVLISQPLTDSSNKRTRPQDTTSTSSPPPVDTNASPSAPDSGTSLEDSQHFPSNSADKGKSVEITPPEPERAASPDASTATIQSSPFAFMLRLCPLLSKDFGISSKPIAMLATRLIENFPLLPLMAVKLPPKDQVTLSLSLSTFVPSPIWKRPSLRPFPPCMIYSSTNMTHLLKRQMNSFVPWLLLTSPSLSQMQKLPF